MVLLETKSKSSSSSPIGLVTPNDKNKVSFSDLLKGISEKKDTKLIQNGVLALSPENQEKSVKSSKEASKTDILASLLKNKEAAVVKKQEEKDFLELNPKLVESLSKEDIKALVSDAKNYLKSKIEQSEGYKKAQVKELPKTLGGLIEAAKKFGVDIEKISIEEVKSVNKDNKKELHVKEGIETKDIAWDNKKELHVKENIVSKEVLQDKKASQALNDKQQSNNAQTESIREIKNDEKTLQTKKETPIFKAQTSFIEHTTTEQIVQAKSNNLSKTEQKTEKSKADETLKLLLRNEKSSLEGSTLTADFSVATAKVIAPSAATDTMKSLEKLLNSEALSSKESESTALKTDSTTIQKADSFEVKLNEAKQMIKYLSTDVKNAIDDYKSPFTRVKVQLNPQHLGEVDLTVVQRGKNLHVNISSNNAAVNMLAMNSNELKTQLNNSGINNATLNFSDSSQNSNTNGGEHQKRENERKAEQEYGYFESEETNEEILSSLEIVVPRYI